MPMGAQAVETMSFSSIEEYFANLGMSAGWVNGALLIGNVRTEKDKYGRVAMARGCLRFLEIVNEKGQHWIRVESNFDDKETLKAKLLARFDGASKKWGIPFPNLFKVFGIFPNVEIAKEVAPIFQAVFAHYDSPVAIKNLWKYNVPQGIQASLYTHQKTGTEFIINQKRAVLGLAVGLGKTLTSIAAAKELINQGKVERWVVICPNSVKYNWKAEVEQYSDMKAVVLESDELRKCDTSHIWKGAEKAHFIIVNYDIIRKPEVAERLHALAPQSVIVDEAHKLKNEKAVQTQAFKKTWEGAEFVWFLSATPFPNGKPKETYTVLSHLIPELVGTWKDFGRKYVTWEFDGYGHKAVGLKVDKLRTAMEECVFIRTHYSKDVDSDMPKERHFTYKLDMSSEQKKMYDIVSSQIWDKIQELMDQGYEAHSSIVIAQLKKLEQVALDPDMLLEDKSQIDMKNLYTKEEWVVNTILDHLDDDKNRGVVVFCDMKLPLKKVSHALLSNGLKESEVAFIAGGVSPEERQAIQNRFKAGEVKVVLCTSAGEEGINLQHGAHTLIHLDQPWVPKAVTQREGRVLRQGQPSPFVSFYTPLIKDSVEDRKRATLSDKVEVIEALLGEGSVGSAANNIAADTDIKYITLSDIKEMLGVA